jgi:hypothetical protein
MKLLGIYVGALLSSVFGAGIFFFKEDTQHDEPFDMVAVCAARGGSWVYGSSLPLCMTPDEGLLEFVDGSFKERTDGTDNETDGADIAYDPWEEGFEPLLAGEELTQEESGGDEEGAEEGERRGGTSPALMQECAERKTEEYTGRIADVDFSSWPDASKYKTAITKDVARGASFAGSYVVSTWGCAKNRRAAACVGHAIVDARTGEIVLYDVVGKRTGDFSVDSNMFSVVLQSGEEKVWSVEGDELVNCP